MGFMEDGKTVLVECKVSRSDFHADKNKHHNMGENPVAHFQYYLCEKNVIQPQDLKNLPHEWGLLWIKSTRAISVIKYPKNISYILYGNDKKYQAAETYARYIMTSALFRAEKKGLIPRLNKAFDDREADWDEISVEVKGVTSNPKYLGTI